MNWDVNCVDHEIQGGGSCFCLGLVTKTVGDLASV